MIRCIVVGEWATPVILGGEDITLLAAWYGPRDELNMHKCVTVRRQLLQELTDCGYVWLYANPFRFEDPAPGYRKCLTVFFTGENMCAGGTGVMGAAYSILLRSSYKLGFSVITSMAAGAKSSAVVVAAASGTISWMSAALAMFSPVLGAFLVGYDCYTAWSNGQGRAFHCFPELPAHHPPSWVLPSWLLGEDVIQVVQTFFSDLPACSICLNPLFWGNDLVFTPCNHCFHSTCVRAWNLRVYGCPVCRASIQPGRVIDLTELLATKVDDLALYGIDHLSLELIQATLDISVEWSHTVTC